MAKSLQAMKALMRLRLSTAHSGLVKVNGLALIVDTADETLLPFHKTVSLRGTYVLVLTWPWRIC